MLRKSVVAVELAAMQTSARFSVRSLLAVIVVAALMVAPLAKPAAVGLGPPLFAGMLVVSYGVCQAIQDPRWRPFWGAYLASVCFYAMFFVYATSAEDGSMMWLISSVFDYDKWYDHAASEGEELVADFVFMFTMQIGCGVLLSFATAGLADAWLRLGAKEVDGD